MTAHPSIDARDEALIAGRRLLFDALPGPRVGDYIDFADGVTRRISHIWSIEPRSIQTSEGGSFYFDNGFCSFSGGLHPGIPADTLTLMPAPREGTAWCFHHDYATAHNGGTFTLLFRVYACTLTSTARGTHA